MKIHFDEHADPTPITRPNFCGGYRCYDIALAGESRCLRCKHGEREQRESRRVAMADAPRARSRR
jgi:hypothetical protein